MRIGVLGSGNMGGALGKLWAQQRHEVYFGSRNSEKARTVADVVGRGTQGGSLSQAANFGEVLVHTAREAMPSSLADRRALDGKIMIDINNTPMPSGFDFEPISTSYAERFQNDVPTLRVVKAFNTIPVQVFDHCPDRIRQYDVSIFVASDDSNAKTLVMELAGQIGFTPIDSGPLRNARLLEAFGDMIRYLINGTNLGACTTISAHVLPKA